jgi:hypothetical protein
MTLLQNLIQKKEIPPNLYKQTLRRTRTENPAAPDKDLSYFTGKLLHLEI